MKIDIRQVAYKPAEQGMAGQSNSSPPKNFLKPVCGISVVKQKITPVFTEVILYLVEHTIQKSNPMFIFINGLFGCVFIRDKENEK